MAERNKGGKSGQQGGNQERNRCPLYFPEEA